MSHVYSFTNLQLGLGEIGETFLQSFDFCFGSRGFLHAGTFFLIDRFMAAVVFSGVVSNSLICSASRCSMM